MINAIPSIFYINFGKIRRMDVFGILDKEVDHPDFRRRYLYMNSVDVTPFLRY